MRRPAITGFVCLALAWTCAAGAAAIPSDWPFYAEVRNSGEGLTRMTVPPGILDASLPSLQDLRLFGADGREIPYLIERPSPRPREWRSPEQTDVSIEKNSTIIFLKTDSSRTVDGVRITSPAGEFLKSCRVEFSNDGRTWTTLERNRPLFRRLGGPEQLEIKIPPGRRPYLRIILDDERSPAIAVTGADVLLAQDKQISLLQAELPIEERVEWPEHTRLSVKLPARNMSWSHVRFDILDPLFMRPVMISGRSVVQGEIREDETARATIFRVALEGQAPESELNVPVRADVPIREWIISIQNGNSPPLDIRGVRGFYAPVQIVFRSPGAGIIKLAAGNPNARPPVYDLEGLRTYIDAGRLGSATAGVRQNNPDYREPDLLPFLVAAGGAIDVSGWAYRKRLTLSGSGYHELTLDLDVLSHSDPSCRDLRLVSGGIQIPYILDRAGPYLSMSIPHSPGLPPEKSKISRWLLRPSHSHIPFTVLSCAVTEPIFHRNVMLSEELNDNRGNRRRHELGAAVWTRTSDAARDTMYISLRGVPESDELFLDIENADNPPLTVRSVLGYYHPPRLSFKAPGDSEIYLYYGNPQSRAPRYDIGIVAEKILGAAKHTALINAVESLKPAAWWGHPETSSKPRLWFWAALTAAAICLLAIIVKLLPKNTVSSK